MRQMAGQRRGERTAGAMRGIRALTVRLENLRLGSPVGPEAQEIDRLLQVAAGDDHVDGSQTVQTGGRLAHLLEIRHRHSSQGAGFVKIRSNQLCQRKQSLD